MIIESEKDYGQKEPGEEMSINENYIDIEEEDDEDVKQRPGQATSQMGETRDQYEIYEMLAAAKHAKKR